MLKSALQKKLRKQKIPKPEKSRKTKKIALDPDDEIPKLIPISQPTALDKEILDLGAQFRVEPTNVQQAVEASVKFTSENPKLKNKLFDEEEFPIFLQINCIKTPQQQSQIIRIALKHSLLTPLSEVCLIVPDVKGIRNKEHDEHLDHYEKLFQQKGVTNIKKIMTFHEFRTEYETFEMKRKLVELYDVFLVDGRISGKTVAKCGKIFYSRRKIPIPVKLKASKLKEHIAQTLMKTPLYVHSKGDSFVVQIGHSKMMTSELVENTFYAMKGLDKHFPGGFANVRSLNLFTYRGIVVPIYTTFKNQNDIILKKLPDNYVVNTESGELSTKMNTRVVVKPTGAVIVEKLNEKRGRKRTRTEEKKEEKDDDDEEENEDDDDEEENEDDNDEENEDDNDEENEDDNDEENEDDDDEEDTTALKNKTINKSKSKSGAGKTNKVKKVQEGLAVIDENEVKSVNGETSKKKRKTDTKEGKKVNRNQEEPIANGNKSKKDEKKTKRLKK